MLERIERELNMSLLRRIGLFSVALALVLPLVMGQSLERVSNSTLSLPPTLPAGDYQLEVAFPQIRGFSQPVAIVTPPGETERIFIVEKAGRIRLITDLENPVRETFLTLNDRVNANSGEQGLLGLAFHPDYQRNGTFFVFYTARGSGAPNRLSRFQVDPNNANLGLADSEVILFSQRDDAGNHNAGDIHFGPDGYLYVALGDEGAANDSLRNSQRLDRDFFAGILRIDPDKRPGNLEPNPHPAIELNEDGSANYLVPTDNPYVDTIEFDGNSLVPREVRTEFWAVGLRNPWRMTFDPVTGELITGDVGQGRLEEVNIIEKGGNYGWNYREGTIAGPNRSQVPEGIEFIDPVLEYGHGSGPTQGNSITGGIVYRGTRFADLWGAYLFADYVSGNIWSMQRRADGSVEWERLTGEAGISAFGSDPRNGDVLLADFNSNRIWRLVQSESNESTETALPEKLSEVGAFENLASLAPNPGIVPYTINNPFWSDHALKQRWFSVPDTGLSIGFSAVGNWAFPAGSLWIKHFELELERGNPESRRRLETRFLVKQEQGVYGVTYRWNEEQTDAVLVPEEGLDETILIDDGGEMIEQVWRYPSRSECLSCHTQQSGGALGFNTLQLNRVHDFGAGEVSQIQAYSTAGYFSEPVDGDGPLDRLSSLRDESATLAARFRSYLDANCSQCHQPGGESIGLWDARFERPLLEAGLLNGSLANPSIHPERRIIVAGDPESSEIYRRITSTGSDRMPPLGSNVLDQDGIDVVRRFITESLSRENQREWAERFFGSALDPRAAGGSDFDGDGFTNDWEYRLGTSPVDGDDFWSLQLQVADGVASLAFPVLIDESIRLTLQSSQTLGLDSVWEDVPLDDSIDLYGTSGAIVEIEQPFLPRGAVYYRGVFTE